MTVSELHITINLFLQEINSNVYGNVLPEEIDFIFNQEALEYIESIIDKDKNPYKHGFAINTARLMEIQELISTKILDTYVVDDTLQYSVLPSDCQYPIRVNADVYNNCNSTVVPVTASGEHRVVINIKKWTTTPQRVIIKDGLTTIFDSNTYFGSPVPIDKFYELLTVIYDVLSQTYTIDWDKYNYRVDSSFGIIVPPLTVFGVEYTTASSNQTFNSVATGTDIFVFDQEETRNKRVRILNNEEVDILKDHSFGKSTFKNPFSYLEQDKLFLQKDNSFIYKTVFMEYIRFPKKISISLNQQLELNDRTLIKIARKTAEKLALIKGSSIVENIIRANITNN